jgi:hypothetical protein
VSWPIKPSFFLTLAKAITVGDEVTFPIPESDTVGPEILVAKKFVAGRMRYLYQGPVGYVSQPKQDNRGHHFVSAEVQQESIGIGSIFLPCEVRREYFIACDTRPKPPRIPLSTKCYIFLPLQRRPNYALRLSCAIWSSSRRGVPHAERVALERAFNIVGQPELRACYDSLLADREAPAIFPYGGLGLFLWPASLHATARRSLPVASLRFHRISGDGSSTSYYGNVISTTIVHCAAMRVANLSSGSIPSLSKLTGTTPGTNGSSAGKQNRG